MANLNLKSLVNKLNPLCRKALEAAAGLCLSRTNYNVEIEHWLIKLLEPADGDLARLLKHYDVDTTKVVRELTHSLDGLRTGNARAPELSLELLNLMREAWVLAGLEFNAARVRSGYVLAALLTEPQLTLRAKASSPELGKIAGEKLLREARTLVEGSSEDEAERAAAAAQGGPGASPPQNTQSAALDQFTTNLTERAAKNQIDPVIGRDAEIRQLIDILLRRRQNNPILTGEAGVGKTAVVEGFALRIAKGDVPLPLRNVTLRILDLGLLQAGAGIKGEFENRLKSVIAEVKASPKPIILFIDEAHTLIGAGGGAGQSDAANLLKPALARGELRTIAATTWNEYKKYFETDAALKRRFQVVKVEEPDGALAVRMMRGLSTTLEKHHKVFILDNALADAVSLSQRYLVERQLPDKSISLLDTACARVSLTQSTIPAALEDCRRDIDALDVEIGIVERESQLGQDFSERLTELKDKKKTAEERAKALEKRWGEEQKLVEEIQKLRNEIVATADGQAAVNGTAPANHDASRSRLAEVEAELEHLQGDFPLVYPAVNGQVVAEVVSGWTGIPIRRMVRNEIEAVQTLQQRLQERVIGQSHALEAIAKRIQTARADLLDPRRPIGVFLLMGPSGVGKTETAMALADLLYGGDQNMVVINMSEYKEDHKISRLTGSAPGYVGYGEGGVLTEAVRRRPYSIVLLDEVEKANVAVQEIFYQVFDKGMLQDDKGNEVNFKNTIILLTANVGTDTVMKLCADPDTRPGPEALAEALRPDLLKAFKPALLGRLHVIPYYPLGDDVIRLIVQLQLKRIADRIKLNHRAIFTYDSKLVEAVVSRCHEVESGARNVDHILTGTLLPLVAQEILGRMAEEIPVDTIHSTVNEEGQFEITVNNGVAPVSPSLVKV
jgi:type VI secretion system protein VasG